MNVIIIAVASVLIATVIMLSAQDAGPVWLRRICGWILESIMLLIISFAIFVMITVMLSEVFHVRIW